MRAVGRRWGFMQEEDRMGRFGATAILIVAAALPAVAAELPTRKAGLWEVKMSFENRNGAGQSIQQCIDPATDQAMQSSTGPLAQAAFSKRDTPQSCPTPPLPPPR